MSAHPPIDWRRAGLTALRWSLRLTLQVAGWSLNCGGRLLQRLGALLNTASQTLPPASPEPRRE